MLADAGSAEARIMETYGLALVPLDDEMRAYFGSDSSDFLVSAVRRGTPAYAASLRAGDLVVAIDGRSTATLGGIVELLSDSSDRHVVTRKRGKAIVEVQLSRTQSTSGSTADSMDVIDGGIELADAAAPSGVAIVAVRAGSPAATAGLRAGDRLLRIGTRDIRGAVSARRLLDRLARGPTFIVFERDSTQQGVLLRR
jgi:serine protease Do